MNQPKELYVDSVQFSYSRKQPLLIGGYLKCRVGDIIGLLGRNGSGKSTLMKIIFGTLRAHHSYIRINGIKTRKAYLTNKIGYLPQDSFLPKHKKVHDLLQLLIGDKQLLKTLSDHARIQTIRSKKVYQLSSGERRYLEIGILLYQPTDFILLDEPFTGLSPQSIEDISALILQFKNTKGIVLSDHDYHHVWAISTQILLLQNGSCRPIDHKKELEFHYLPEGTVDKK